MFDEGSFRFGFYLASLIWCSGFVFYLFYQIIQVRKLHSSKPKANSKNFEVIDNEEK